MKTIILISLFVMSASAARAQANAQPSCMRDSNSWTAVEQITTPDAVTRCLTTKDSLLRWWNTWAKADYPRSAQSEYPWFSLKKDPEAFFNGVEGGNIVDMEVSSFYTLPHWEQSERIRWQSLGSSYSGSLVPEEPTRGNRALQLSYGKIEMAEKDGRVLDLNVVKDRLEFAQDFVAAVERERKADPKKASQVSDEELQELKDILASFALVNQKLGDIYKEALSHGRPVPRDFTSPTLQDLNKNSNPF